MNQSGLQGARASSYLETPASRARPLVVVMYVVSCSDFSEKQGRAAWASLPELADSGIEIDKSQELGRGGFGRVYFGRMGAGAGGGTPDLSGDTVEHRRAGGGLISVAVRVEKVTQSKGHRPKDVLPGFLAWEALPRHPNVLALLGNFEARQESTDFFVCAMELCPLSLHTFLKGTGHTITSSNLAMLTRDLLSAVAHCHNHWVLHLDIKPANILLQTRASTVRFLLSDFGSAKQVKSWVEGSTCIEGLFTTMPWAAPEMFSGHPVGFPADAWSVGVILAECALAESPLVRLRREQADAGDPEQWPPEKWLEAIEDTLSFLGSVQATVQDPTPHATCLNYACQFLKMSPGRRMSTWVAHADFTAETGQGLALGGVPEQGVANRAGIDTDPAPGGASEHGVASKAGIDTDLAASGKGVGEERRASEVACKERAVQMSVEAAIALLSSPAMSHAPLMLDPASILQALDDTLPEGCEQCNCGGNCKNMCHNRRKPRVARWAVARDTNRGDALCITCVCCFRECLRERRSGSLCSKHATLEKRLTELNVPAELLAARSMSKLLSFITPAVAAVPSLYGDLPVALRFLCSHMKGPMETSFFAKEAQGLPTEYGGAEVLGILAKTDEACDGTLGPLLLKLGAITPKVGKRRKMVKTTEGQGNVQAQVEEQQAVVVAALDSLLEVFGRHPLPEPTQSCKSLKQRRTAIQSALDSLQKVFALDPDARQTWMWKEMLIVADSVLWEEVPLPELTAWCGDTVGVLRRLPTSWTAKDAATHLGVPPGYISVWGRLLRPLLELAKTPSGSAILGQRGDAALRALATYQLEHHRVPTLLELDAHMRGS